MDARTLTHQLGGHWRNGQGLAPCPVCQTERRRDQRALSISNGSDKILLYCFKSGCDFRDIADAAQLPFDGGGIDPQASLHASETRAEYEAVQLAKARSLWDYSAPIDGTKAEAYLRGRAITAPLPDTLRFAPDIMHGPSTAWGCAMIGLVEPTGGVHRTFFDKKGNRLPKSAKMMLGPCAGGAVRLSDGAGPLVVCEGVETGLSLLSGLLDGPHEVWAALSTSGIKALHLPETPHKLIVAADGDPPGQAAGCDLASRAYALGWDVSLMPAPNGQDWNDVLTRRAAS